MRFWFSFLVIGMICISTDFLLQAQPADKCASDDVLREQLKDPEFRQKYQQLRQSIKNAAQQRRTKRGQSRAIVTIPVVFHVVWNDSIENISRAQILSQMEILNEDFRRENSDTTNTDSQFKDDAADTKIEFCLAKRDPHGCPTDGITRTKTTKSSFDVRNNYNVRHKETGGKDAWDTDRYLNIWVCNISGGVKGKGTFPGLVPDDEDGVTVEYDAIGDTGAVSSTFEHGRTAVHEVGHYLFLKHTWGDGDCTVDDGINDTPLCNGPVFGCPDTFQCGGNLRQVDNYMDYTDGACQNMFSRGQGDWMRTVIDSLRSNLKSSKVCQSPAIDPPSVKQDFENTEFPPHEWSTLNLNSPVSWDSTQQAGGHGKSSQSAKLNIYGSSGGENDIMYSPAFDLSNAEKPIKVEFDLAYARYDQNNYDSLAIHVSPNCGQDWVQIWGKSNRDLTTAGETTSEFIPSGGEWESKSASFGWAKGNAKVMLAFDGVSGGGNNMYIDNINIYDKTTAIWPRSSTAILKVYPNPARQQVNVQLDDAGNISGKILTIYNMKGQQVKRVKIPSGSSTLRISMADQSDGLYLIRLPLPQQTLEQRFLLIR